jgi:allantoate deiminase
MQFGTTLMRQADELARFTQTPSSIEAAPGMASITRRYLTPEHKAAGEYIIALMMDAGMTASFDALGNIVGRYAGASVGEKADAKWLMTGSHQDTVVNAGRYDGLFGILAPIAAVKSLHARGKRLPFGIEVIAFGDEEGVRFGVTLIGSKARAGSFDKAWLDKQDAEGITLREALYSFGHNINCEHDMPQLTVSSKEYIAFIECHIEQGPVLLNANLPLGVVTSIVGFNRIRCHVKGLAGHAGTVPMHGRQDALAAAAEMTLAVESYALARAEKLVATVGKFEIAQGGAINVIPGELSFTIDLRSGDDTLREQALVDLQAQCEAIAARRKVQFQMESFYSLPAAHCDARLQNALAASLKKLNLPDTRLSSGAGHDAMAFRGVLPLAMLFVRCGNGGISHNPAETMTAEDAELATLALLDFFESFDPALL